MPDLEHDSAPLRELTKHTPGPWQNYLTGNVVDPDGKPLVLGGDGLVAVVTTDADALLITAAPDMLEALKKLDGHLSILMGNIHGSAKVDHRWEGMDHVVRGWRDDIKAVTAKAEGGAA